MAKLGGFDKPIAHGLLSYGYAAKALYDATCNGDANLIKKFSAKFTSHAFPGETYIVEIWRDGNNVIFQSKTLERNVVVLVGTAELRESSKL